MDIPKRRASSKKKNAKQFFSRFTRNFCRPSSWAPEANALLASYFARHRYYNTLLIMYYAHSNRCGTVYCKTYNKYSAIFFNEIEIPFSARVWEIATTKYFCHRLHIIMKREREKWKWLLQQSITSMVIKY